MRRINKNKRKTPIQRPIAIALWVIALIAITVSGGLWLTNDDSQRLGAALIALLVIGGVVITPIAWTIIYYLKPYQDKHKQEIIQVIQSLEIR